MNLWKITIPQLRNKNTLKLLNSEEKKLLTKYKENFVIKKLQIFPIIIAKS